MEDGYEILVTGSDGTVMIRHHCVHYNTALLMFRELTRATFQIAPAKIVLQRVYDDGYPSSTYHTYNVALGTTTPVLGRTPFEHMRPFSEAPKDGTPFDAVFHHTWRWTPYKKGSTPVQMRRGGRFQQAKEYGGFENAEGSPLFFIERTADPFAGEPDLAPVAAE